MPDNVRVVDAHIHLFPDQVFKALWAWFDEHAWPIRYKLSADGVLDFLSERGVKRMVGSVYAHKPGVADQLNTFIAEIAARRPQLAGLGTVMPGEIGDRGIVRRALGELGLAGIKLHCHVQAISANDPRLDVVYEEAARANKPVLIHAGRGPVLDGYHTDVRQICCAAAMADALRRHPETTIVVPHLGNDETEAYEEMLAEFPRLYLDTTMVLADYFDCRTPPAFLERNASRIMYGTDFPNIPYAWERELKAVLAAGLSPEVEAKILYENAESVFGLA